MEEKIRRECKVFIEKLFKKQDIDETGAIDEKRLKKIMQLVVPETLVDDEDVQETLNKTLKEYAKRNRYTVMNSKTKQIEYTYQDNTFDFPSVLAIVVYFLVKREKKESNPFAGKGLITMEELNKRPNTSIEIVPMSKKRLF